MTAADGLPIVAYAEVDPRNGEWIGVCLQKDDESPFYWEPLVSHTIAQNEIEKERARARELGEQNAALRHDIARHVEIAASEAQRAELAESLLRAAERDAERYRWLQRPDCEPSLHAHKRCRSQDGEG